MPQEMVFDARMFQQLRRDFDVTMTRSATADGVREAFANLEIYRSFADHASAGDEEFASDLPLFGRALGDWLRVSPLDVRSPKRIYIPTLRSAVRLALQNSNIQTDLFADTVARNYGWDRDGNLEIFTGNVLYATVRRHLAGLEKYREDLLRFEAFLSAQFFAGATIKITPVDKEDDSTESLYISIKGRGEYPLHMVGDGIQALILLMYRLFTADEGAWLFIEEPEINLHPGLQRIFLHALAHNETIAAKNLRIFMTTHSNHLLGTLIPETADLSVFSFQEGSESGQFLVRPVVDRDHNAMALLGVANSSVLLANCSIWVEGVTDRKYLRAYLKAYQESDEFRREHRQLMREDIHYAFLEYAGSNLAHYFFGDDSEVEAMPERIRALAVCNRIFLLADQDKGKEAKHERLRAAARGTGGHFEYHTTPGIEIENLIPVRVLQLALPRLVQRASETVVQVVVLNEAGYRNKRVGAYLRQVLGPSCPKGIAATSGTLAPYYKDKLASVVSDLVPRTVVWDQLGEPVQELTKALYEFIVRHSR